MINPIKKVYEVYQKIRGVPDKKVTGLESKLEHSKPCFYTLKDHIVDEETYQPMLTLQEYLALPYKTQVLYEKFRDPGHHWV